MGKLLQEADLDDRFNKQMAKVQDAVHQLLGIVDLMTAKGSMMKPTNTQRMQLKHAAEDFKSMWERTQ